MVAESLLLLVVLLIAIAYVLYADRKIWAAVQLRRGPNVVGPWGLLQTFADLLKFCRRALHLRNLVARRQIRNAAISHLVRGMWLRSKSVPTMTVNCFRQALHW